ncbi:interferon-induced GTP-binding protein Mx-like isoform X3 [Acanthopagrus latus]|uniref:interferon-induced GTP-binding protein Mx-like isoform X3 n=1 Tax=Acanthopagrus latus TaxID=8177 RepID=UPI00187BF39A|nr:interferon-induced GTP-binding protein Mx-like isoform X3 [Acanthopagrus latus]
MVQEFTVQLQRETLQVAGRHLAEQSPLVILYQMVQEFTVQPQRETLQVIQDKEKAESLLKEESGIRAKRIKRSRTLCLPQQPTNCMIWSQGIGSSFGISGERTGELADGTGHSKCF